MTDAKGQETLEAIELFLHDESIFNSILDSIFSAIDLDGSGTLDLKEITQFIKEINSELQFTSDANENLIQQIFNEMDKDRSNTIDKKELGEFLKILFKKQKTVLEKSRKSQ
jgi:Ca2+-binding EF-hand superfamily protein